MSTPVEVGRYLLYDAIAFGGMASVHVGRIVGPAGFSRLVAIKRLLPHLARDRDFRAMLLDEARLAARIHHPNVVSTLDIITQDGEIFVVMDLVRGESLASIARRAAERAAPPSVSVASAIIVGALYGLHAAHEATDERGQPLSIVHRDVSPQNVLVGRDGVPRVVDFGIAKAVSRVHSTQNGELKGKLAYMAPEQLGSDPIDRRCDVFAAAVMFWELLTGKRLFVADDARALVGLVMRAPIAPPSSVRSEVGAALDEVVMKGLARDREERYPTALAMADAIARAAPPATPQEVAEWVVRAGGEALTTRMDAIASLESGDVARGRDDLIISAILSGSERRRVIEAPTGTMTADTAIALGSDAPAEDSAAVVARGTRRGAGAIAAFAIVALLTGAAAVIFAPSTPASAPGASAPLADSAPMPSSSATQVEPPAAPPTPSSVSSVVAAPPIQSAPEPPASVATSKHTASHHGPAKSCDPPYVIDEKGIKRFKRWCSP